MLTTGLHICQEDVNKVRIEISNEDDQRMDEGEQGRPKVVVVDCCCQLLLLQVMMKVKDR